MKINCPYCGNAAEKVSGIDIYPHREDLYNKKFWRCELCDAHVGCHPGTEKPLGRLANSELRKAKMQAHSVFDPLWKSKRYSRSGAYQMLSAKLGIPKAQCHIGMFDLYQCKKVVEVCNEIPK